MMRSFYLKAVVIALAVLHGQTIQVITEDTLPLEPLSKGCADALMADVACQSQIVGFGSGSEITTEALEESCTASCNDALSKYEGSVAAACTEDDVYDVSEARTAPVSFLPTLLYYQFNKTCIQDGNRWCHAIVYGMSSGNEEAITGNATSSMDMCDNCAIKEIQFQAGSPIYGGYALQSDYSSLTSSCSKTNFPLATSSVPFSRTDTTSTATPTPSPSCAGDKYTIQPGDTCRSISKSQGIGTAWLMQDNNLEAFCADFPTSGDLCIVHGCKTYTVQANDSCKSIAKSHRLTQTQVFTWNPILGGSCRNLNRSVADEICISPPGNKVWTPPEAATPTSTSSPSSTATAVSIPSNAANGTTDNCAQYYTIEKGDYCNKIIVKFSISLDDFLFLNTGVNKNCTNLFAEESYCVQPVGSINDYPGSPGYIPPDTSISDSAYSNLPKATYTAPQITGLPTSLPLAKGTRKDCYAYADGADLSIDITYSKYKSVCEALASGWGIKMEQIQNWNPSLNTSSNDCAPKDGYRYCMEAYKVTATVTTETVSNTASETSSQSATPTSTELPIRNGTIEDCDKYIAAESGVTCASILEDNDITISRLYQWNPEVDSDCTNFWPGYRYCVKGPESTPTNTGGPPGPTQTGTAKNCNKWHVVEENENCDTVAKEYGITRAEFLEWNPAITDDCATGFWKDEAYCVGVSS